MEVPALKDKKTGKPSYTLTAFVTGFAVVNIKLLLAGVEIADKIKMSDFSGGDYSMAVAALGALYVGNKKLNRNKEDKKDE